MQSNESRDKKIEEIFDALVDCIKINLNSNDPRWADVAIKFLKHNGCEMSQLPVPGSQVRDIMDTLPFKVKAKA